MEETDHIIDELKQVPDETLRRLANAIGRRGDPDDFRLFVAVYKLYQEQGENSSLAMFKRITDKLEGYTHPVLVTKMPDHFPL